MIDDLSLRNIMALAGQGTTNVIENPPQLSTMLNYVRGVASGLPENDAARVRVAAEQLALQRLGYYPKNSAIDGLVGPNTRDAERRWIAAQRKATIPKLVASILATTPNTHPTNWPKQADVPSFYGARGANQVRVPIPWAAALSWNPASPVREISLHRKVADSTSRVFERIHREIGEDQIRNLGLHLFGGSLNVRRMRNGGAWSMHSWGIAIDWDTERNQLTWGRDRARLGKPDAEPMWRIWEDEGWVSLGRTRNYDWMHVQAARL